MDEIRTKPPVPPRRDAATRANRDDVRSTTAVGSPSRARAAWKSALDRDAPPVRAALLVASIALLLRVVLLLAPGPLVAPDWVYPEEVHRGNVAREILRGPLLDLQDYHHAPNVGGSLVVAALAVPFVAVLGDDILAVRLPTVLFHSAAVFLLFLLLDRFASRRAAWIGAILLAVSPPGYALISVTAWGSHLENNTFTLLALYSFLRLQERYDDGRATSRRGFVLGIVAGFACYFGYSFFAALATILALAFLRDRAFFVRRWFVFACGGFAIGLLPWLRYNAINDWAALTIYDRGWVGAGEHAWLTGIEKVGWFFATYFPFSLYFRDFDLVDTAWIGGTVAGLLFSLFAFMLWSSRRVLANAVHRFVRVRQAPPELDLGLVSAIYFLFFLGAFASASAFTTILDLEIAHDGRYATPIVPFFCLAAGLALDRLAELGREPRRAARLIGIGLVAAFLLGFAGLVDVRRFGSGTQIAGTSEEEFARWFAWRFKTDIPRLERLVDGLERRRTESERDGTIFVVAETLKSRMQIIPADDRVRGAFRQSCRAALRFLHDRVDERYKLYCEEPWFGEPMYSWRQRDEFRRAYAEHARTDASHVATEPAANRR